MLRQAAHRLWETIGKADNVAHLGVGVDEFVVPGYAMKLKVITEGVETAAQLAFLQRHGCDEIRGFYFSKPMSTKRLNEFRRKHDAGRLFCVRPDLHPTGKRDDDDDADEIRARRLGIDSEADQALEALDHHPCGKRRQRNLRQGAGIILGESGK